MKDLESKLHQQFPEARDKCIEVVATELEIYDATRYDDRVEGLKDEYGYFEAENMAVVAGLKTHKLPKGYLAVTTTDNTLYLVKV